MSHVQLIERELTEITIGAFYEVYNTLGYGFLEHIYVNALERELRARGLQVARQVSVWIWYKGQPLTTQRLDLIVEGKVVVEVKSTAELHSAAPRQLFNYLRASELGVGLLLHFGPKPKFHRVVSTRSGRRAHEAESNRPRSQQHGDAAAASPSSSELADSQEGASAIGQQTHETVFIPNSADRR